MSSQTRARRQQNSELEIALDGSMPRIDASQLQVGKIEHEELGILTRVRKLGAGREGVSTLYRDNRGNQYVVKVMGVPEAILDGSSPGKRFLRQSKIHSALDHPRIPKHRGIIDIKETNYCASVTDYLEGKSLFELIEGRPQSEQRVVQLGIEVASILAYLHDPQKHPNIPEPIIHRDVKPQNIIITEPQSEDLENLVHLIDLGFVKSSADELSTMSTIKGTEEYIPFEQLAGQAIPQSDIYSLGVTLAHALYGQHPDGFKHAHAGPVLRESMGYPTREDTFEKMPGSEPLKAIINRMTAPTPEDRYSSAEQVIGELKKLQNPLTPPPYVKKKHRTFTKKTTTNRRQPLDLQILTKIQDLIAAQDDPNQASKYINRPRLSSDWQIGGSLPNVEIAALHDRFYRAADALESIMKSAASLDSKANDDIYDARSNKFHGIIRTTVLSSAISAAGVIASAPLIPIEIAPLIIGGAMGYAGAREARKHPVDATIDKTIDNLKSRRKLIFNSLPQKVRSFEDARLDYQEALKDSTSKDDQTLNTIEALESCAVFYQKEVIAEEIPGMSGEPTYQSSGGKLLYL